MGHFCFKCRKDLGGVASKVGRRESCPHCAQDLHCCKQCNFFDVNAYNQCKEPQADRVLDKDSSNFCDYFQMREGLSSIGAGNEKATTLKKLDDLFRK